MTRATDTIEPQILLEARGLHRTFGEGATEVRAIENVNLAVRAGELVAIMGASGSGKSTLLQALGGLDALDAGSVIIEGQAIADLSRKALTELRRRHLSVVFQDLNLISSMTLLENVMLPLELDGLHRSVAIKLAGAALAEVGVDDLQNRFPDDVSGGQRQRAAVARSFVGDRRLMLADEPTGSLDSVASEQVIGLIRAKVDAGMAAIVVTHDSRVAAWADRILIMQDGRLVDEVGGNR